MASPGPRVIWMPGGVRTEIHLGAEQTAGAMAMLVDHPPEGWSLQPHLHRNEAETIHVIAGHFEMVVGGDAAMIGPGDTLHIPAGEIHSGRLLGGVGQRLVTFTPGGIESFFLEVGTSQPSDRVDLSRTLAAAGAHGWEFMPGGR